MLKAKSTQVLNRWWFCSGLVLVWLFYQAFDFMDRQWSSNVPLQFGPAPMQRAVVLNRIGLLVITAASFALLVCRRLKTSGSALSKIAIAIPLLAFFLLHAESWFITRHNAVVWVEDVGETSITADRGLLHGIDPYSASLDSSAKLGSLHFRGYKYFPVTMAVYFPGALLAGDDMKYGARAVLDTNFVLTIAAAAVLIVSLGRWVSADAGLLCALLFFVSRSNSLELVRTGSNDIIPMILVVLAVLNLDRRWTCGLLVGLAISAKLLPGSLWIPICLTPRRPLRYAAGVACGLLPCVPFFLWNPRAFVANPIVFALSRPREEASVLNIAPHWFQIGAEFLVGATFVVFGVMALRREISPLRRVMWVAALTLAFQVASPIMHQNYYIWWYMPLCVSFTVLVFNPATYEWISRSHMPK